MTTAPSRTAFEGLRARTRIVAGRSSPLDLLPAPAGALAWVRDGEGLAGWGEAARFEIRGAGRFAAADEWWRSCAASMHVRDDVRLPGTGPVAFVSMAFADHPGHSVLVVPRVVVGRRDGVSWVTEIGPAGGDAVGTPFQPVQSVRRPSMVRYSEGVLPVTAYREAVREAVTRMRAGQLDKVVLAHDLVAAADIPVDPRFLLRGLARRYPSCWAFAVDGLVGATPELLLRRSGDIVTSRVLAGTSWPRAGMDSDQLAAALLASAKNRGEHAYAVESLANTLRPFCSSLSVPSAPSVLRLPNVLHLASDIAGNLAPAANGERTSLLRLVAAVHPTAAVGGTPRQAAVSLIAELEGMDRGRYAGPVGWVDGRGDGEMGIALRCAQISGNTVRMFAGCGVVADSDPDTEVSEAAAKFVPVRDALEDVGDT